MIESIPGLWPGEVDSYNQAARTCRVRIPGVTDGSAVLPEAVIMPPIGDRAYAADSKDHTELRILPGDAVWLMFEAGDPRFPIIVGARPKRTGNPTNWRRWRHANIEMTADGELVFNATNVTWNISGNETRHVGGNASADVGGNHSTTVTGSMSSEAASSTHEAATHSITASTSVTGPLAVSGGLTNAGVNVGKTHTHTEQGDGNEVSTPH